MSFSGSKAPEMPTKLARRLSERGGKVHIKKRLRGFGIPVFEE